MTEVLVNKDEFSSWLALAQEDPEAFELERQKVLEAHIRALPEAQQHRLRCLQWRVDQVRARAKTPLAACIAISEMMWDAFYQLHCLYQEVDKLGPEGQTKLDSIPTAEILAFPQ